jgi:chloramphenicol O-acetyltransferase type A
MKKIIHPKDSTRFKAFNLWLHAPNPMITFFKTLDITNLVNIHKKSRLKINMLILYCIGNAASNISEFFTLPVGEKLIQYDSLAVNTIVKNNFGDINSCDIVFNENLDEFNRDYLKYTAQVAETCQDRDLSDDFMVIGTSSIIETELDGVIGMNSGFNNPFLFWGKYRKNRLKYYLPVSFQFHHTQMDGSHAGKFLESLQTEINNL